jgi:hypothetical protein
MHNGWRYLIALWALVVVCACGTPPITPAPAPTATLVSAPTTLVVWHAMGGSNEVALRDVFNQIAVGHGFQCHPATESPSRPFKPTRPTHLRNRKGRHRGTVKTHQLQTILSNRLCCRPDRHVARRGDALMRRTLASAGHRPRSRINESTGCHRATNSPCSTTACKVCFSAPSSSDDLLSILRIVCGDRLTAMGLGD